MLSVNDKIEILKDMENGIKASEISKKFGIHKSTVTKIKQNKGIIERFTSETSINPKNMKRMRHAQYEEVEKLLHAWFLLQRALKKIVTNDLLKMKAKEIHQNLGGSQRFLVSDGWLTKFKKRYGILLTKSGEKLSCDEVYNEGDDNDNENNANINRVIDSFDTTIEWAECNNFTLNEILLLRRMREKAVLQKFD